MQAVEERDPMVKLGVCDLRQVDREGEYLFRAGFLYESMGRNKEAIDAYKQIKEKFPRSDRGIEIDKYLARLGVIEE